MYIMAYFRGKIALRFALFGLTGRGKSSLGNALLGKNVFPTSKKRRSENSECAVAEKMQNGRKISVVDTPGFFDKEITYFEFVQGLVSFLDKSSPGPNVFLFLIKADLFEFENSQAVRQYCEIFGEKVIRHTIVVFTHLNADTTEELYISYAPLELQFFLNKCENRYVFMPIPSRSDARGKMQTLMNMADQLVSDNNGECYTDEMYRAHETLIKEKSEEQSLQKRHEEEKMLKEIKDQISAQYEHKMAAFRNDMNTYNAIYRTEEQLIKERHEEQARQKRQVEEERIQKIKYQISVDFEQQMAALRNDVNMFNAMRERRQGETKILEMMEKNQQNMDELQKTINMQNEKIDELSSTDDDEGCTIL